MTDLIERLYSMQGMGDVQLKALMDGVGPKGAEEIKRLRAELAETRANYEQYGTAMGQNLEDRDSEIERLRAELDDVKINIQFLARIKASYEELIGEMQSTWLSKDTYETLMRERAETLKEMADMRTELDALKKQEPVAWRTFDGEGGYDYRGVDGNEGYRDEFIERNPNHATWVEPL